MMLWNEKPNKNKTLPYLTNWFLWDTKNVTDLMFFTILIDFFVGMKL